MWHKLTGLQWTALAVLVLVICIVAWQWYSYDPSPGNWGDVKFR